jgi:hypothetical protein
MTPTRGRIARIIIAAACAATVGTAMAVPGAERWISLPSQPDSIASLDAGSVQLYQGALTVSETRFGNDAGWQRVDGVGLAAAVAHELCAG